MDHQQNQMQTLSQVMETLRKRGIQREFCMNEAGEMRLQHRDKIYLPEDLIIVRVYRFEGESDPDDNAVLYVVEDEEKNLGMIIDTYGVDNSRPDDKFDEFLRKIPVKERDF